MRVRVGWRVRRRVVGDRAAGLVLGGRGRSQAEHEACGGERESRTRGYSPAGAETRSGQGPTGSLDLQAPDRETGHKRIGRIGVRRRDVLGVLIQEYGRAAG